MVIDASKLQAERVIVAGQIKGGSKVSVRGRRVEILEGVHGNSELTVEATGGGVVFAKKGGVHGSSKVSITAREVELSGPLTGSTITTVTLSPKGVLNFKYADGSARLDYRNASKKDPEPTIHKGDMHGGALLRRVE